jgi:L-arabinose isomerase
MTASSGKLTVQRRKPLTARVGVLGVGHHTYWAQFEGLYEKMEEKLAHLVTKLQGFGVAVTSFGIADRAQHAYALVSKIKSADLDLLFVDMLTYATSSVIGAVFREIDLPIVLVALQPLAAMDYENGSTFVQLLNDDICVCPSSPALRFGWDARRWCAEGPTHHFALGIGHLAQVIKQIADVLGIEAVVVTDA